MKTYRILNYNSKSPVFISCEHASKVIPKRYGFLGVKKSKLIDISDYYDTGAEEISRVIAKGFNAKCIFPTYSRMVINVNRSLSHRNLINADCHGIKIPGNENITEKERKKRITNYYLPYHKKIKKEIEELKKKHKKIYYICMHTFLYIVPGRKNWPDIGILYKYNKDAEFCRKIKNLLAKRTNFRIEINKPFSAKTNAGYTMGKYGKSNKIRCVEFEVNDKHLQNKKAVRKIGSLILSILKEAIND